MTSIYDIDKGDHLCTDQQLYYHHFIVATNYVKQGGRKNGKELKIIEFDGPQTGTKTKARMVTADKNLTEFGEVYKIDYTHGEAFDSGELQMKLVTNFFQCDFCNNLMTRNI